MVQSRSEKWAEFRRRYFRELDSRPEAWQPIVSAARRGTVTLVYSSHDTQHNNAVALQEFLRRKARRPARPSGRSRRAGRGDRGGDPFMRPRHVTLVRLRPIPPFRLDLTVWALRRRPRNLIDRWDGTTYRRVIVIGRTADRTGRAAGKLLHLPEADRDGNPAAADAAGETTRAIDRRSAARPSDRSDRLVPMAAGDARLRPLADRFEG